MRTLLQETAARSIRLMAWRFKSVVPATVHLVGRREYETCILGMDSSKWGPHLEEHKGPRDLEAVALLMWTDIAILDLDSKALTDEVQGHIFLWIDGSSTEARFWRKNDVAFRPLTFNDFAPDFLDYHIRKIPGARWRGSQIPHADGAG